MPNTPIPPVFPTLRLQRGRTRYTGPVAGSVMQFTPRSVANLLWWYSARSVTGLSNGNAINGLVGLETTNMPSVLARTIGVNPPSYNTNVIDGNPVVTFDGTAKPYTISTATTFGTSSWHFFAVLKTGSGVTAAQAILGSNVNSALEIRIDNSKFTVLKGNVVGMGQNTTSISTSTAYLIDITYNGGTGALAFFLNGTADGTVTNSQNFTAINNQIGRGTGSSTDYANFQLAEVLMYTAILTGDNVTNVRNYLKGIYNL